MSDEYRISGAGAAAIDSIARSLFQFGLRISRATTDTVSMSYEGADTAQTERWGGNIHIAREGADLLITFNALARREQVLAQIVTEIDAQGASLAWLSSASRE